MANRKPTRMASFSEVIAINEVLKKVCTTSGEGDAKVATFAEGWYDGRVADELQVRFPTLSVHSVRNVRTQEYGKLTTRPKFNMMVKGNPQIADRVSALEAKMAKLLAWAKEVEPNADFGG